MALYQVVQLFMNTPLQTYGDPICDDIIRWSLIHVIFVGFVPRTGTRLFNLDISGDAWCTTPDHGIVSSPIKHDDRVHS